MRDFCWCTDCEQVKSCGSEAVTSDEVRDAIKGKAKSEKVMSTKGHGRGRGSRADAGDAGGKVFPGMRRSSLGFHFSGLGLYSWLPRPLR